MMSPVIYTAKNYFIFYKERRSDILIIFSKSKDLKLKFSSAYKTCFRTKKEFSIKNYDGHSRKLTSGVAVWMTETSLKNYLKTDDDCLSGLWRAPDFFFLGLKIIVVFCWRLELQGLKWFLTFCLCSSFCIIYPGKVWSGSTKWVAVMVWKGSYGRGWEGGTGCNEISRNILT